jgi:Spy/CpxP family protein refolding chaperone
MNKKIILGLTATALLASSLLAFNSQGQMQQGNNAGCKQGKMMKGGHERGKHMFMKTVMKLDLSDEQRTKVMAIVKKSMQSMPNPRDAFTDTSFDKKEFIKLAKERRDAKRLMSCVVLLKLI